jgi:hypothetical protein
MSQVIITLSYSGGLADENQIDLYDASHALVGFQRTLALTTHLLLNDEIITQATSLKGAHILSLPPQEGSWKTVATVVFGTMLATGTASRDSMLGHLATSAYDYVVSETLGFHVDFDEALGQQLEEYAATHGEPKITQPRVDSLIEKCESSIVDMHRPIVKSRTAIRGEIISVYSDVYREIGPTMDVQTYDYVNYTEQSEDIEIINGKISSYNMNTFHGRVFVNEEGRPVPFLLSELARTPVNIGPIVASLSGNALKLPDRGSTVALQAYRRTSRSGRLKSFIVIAIKPVDF